MLEYQDREREGILVRKLLETLDHASDARQMLDDLLQLVLTSSSTGRQLIIIDVTGLDNSQFALFDRFQVELLQIQSRETGIPVVFIDGDEAHRGWGALDRFYFHRSEETALLVWRQRYSFQVEKSDGVAIIRWIGTVTIGESVEALRKLVRELLKSYKVVVFDADETNYLDSSGIGEWVLSYTTAKQGGAKFRLSRVRKKVETLLEIQRMRNLFENPDTQRLPASDQEATAF